MTKDEYLYDEWVDVMMGRKHVIGGIFTQSQWTEFSTINSMVQDLFHKKHAGSYEYEKLKPEIRQIVKQVVSMTLFYKEQYVGK
jgi:hypothetical protein